MFPFSHGGEGVVEAHRNVADEQAAGVRLFGVRDDHNLYASLKHGIAYVKGKPGVLAARLERAARA